jgi:hypothetical protein
MAATPARIDVISMLLREARVRGARPRFRPIGVAGGVVAALAAAEAAARVEGAAAAGAPEEGAIPVAADLDDILAFAKICATAAESFAAAAARDLFTPHFMHDASGLGLAERHAHEREAISPAAHEDHAPPRGVTGGAHDAHDAAEVTHHGTAVDPIIVADRTAHAHETRAAETGSAAAAALEHHDHPDAHDHEALAAFMSVLAADDAMDAAAPRADEVRADEDRADAPDAPPAEPAPAAHAHAAAEHVPAESVQIVAEI